MVPFVIFLHVVACILLIFIVLLQTGKGAEVGAVFGSSSVFGPTGPTSVLSKITIGAAVVFMLTSLFLAYSFSNRNFASRSIVPDAKKTAPPKPAMPAPGQMPAAPQMPAPATPAPGPAK